MRNKFLAIMDAVDPGGSGNPYAGLNEEQRAALEEATRLGFPLRGCNVPPAGVAAQARTISYQGVLEQALRDVSAWVERGVRPPDQHA